MCAIELCSSGQMRFQTIGRLGANEFCTRLYLFDFACGTASGFFYGYEYDNFMFCWKPLECQVAKINLSFHY